MHKWIGRKNAGTLKTISYKALEQALWSSLGLEPWCGKGSPELRHLSQSLDFASALMADWPGVSSLSFDTLSAKMGRLLSLQHEKRSHHGNRHLWFYPQPWPPFRIPYSHVWAGWAKRNPSPGPGEHVTLSIDWFHDK